MPEPIPIRTAEERSLIVRPGHIVRSGYVPMGSIDFAIRSPMATGDVDTAFRRRLQLGDAQPWPPPVGRWDGHRFTIYDGRHDFVAALMRGCEHILVAWIDEEGECVPAREGQIA